MNHFDVLIVGGGPAGSSCATMLAKAGLNVALIDKATFPREKICGDCLNPRCWRFFDLLGISEQLRNANLLSIDRVGITSASGGHVSVSLSFPTPTPFFALKRSVLDFMLLSQARSVGAKVFEQTQLLDLRWKNQWNAIARSGDSEHNIASDFIVGADGRNSFVARKLFARTAERGANKEVSSLRVGVQWHTQYQSMIGSSVQMFFFRSGYAGVVNVDQECANVALVTQSSVARLTQTDFSEFLRATILNNPNARQLFRVLDPKSEVETTFPINPQSNRISHPAAFLVGDARQTVEPFTGEGVYFALQDGIKTAGEILARFGKKPSIQVPTRRRFWANQVYSHALRNPRLANRLVSAAAFAPSLLPLAAKTIFRF